MHHRLLVCVALLTVASTPLAARADVPSPPASQTASAPEWKKLVGTWSCVTTNHGARQGSYKTTFTAEGYNIIGPERVRAWFEKGVIVVNEGEGYARSHLTWQGVNSFILTDATQPAPSTAQTVCTRQQ